MTALRDAARAARDYFEWKRRSETGPPPHFIKQRALRTIAARYGLRTLVETGTYLGDMVAAMRPHFDRIVSIELAPELARRARTRFAGDARVTILEGDSGALLPQVLASLDRPALFWLDGHYSGGFTARAATDTPVLQELEAIFADRNAGHVVLVDDARLFDGANGYPTLDAMRSLIAARRPNWEFSVRHDSIRLLPKLAD